MNMYLLSTYKPAHVLKIKVIKKVTKSLYLSCNRFDHISFKNTKKNSNEASNVFSNLKIEII